MTFLRAEPTIRTALLAAALLAACAGPQKPEPRAGETAAAAPEAEAAQPSAAAAASPSDGPAKMATRVKATAEAQRRARAAFAEGVRLEAAGDLGAAASAFDRAFAADIDLIWAGFDAGLTRERLGDDAAAVAAYEKTIEATPAFAPAAQNLARIWVRQGRQAQAEQELRARLAKADGVALRVGLAEVLLSAGKLDEAEAECRSALKADEKNLPAMVLLATTYGGKKRFELARMVLENARQVDASDPAVWNRLGFVEMALGNRVQAIEHFKTAAALRPDYPEAHANYGTMLADADDFAGAAQELELAVKYAPRSAGAWLNLGNAYRGLQQFEKAESAYRKAEQLDGALAEVSFDLAVLYLDVEKPGLPTLQRLEQGVAHFDAFERRGGVEPRVAAYRKDAAREIDREKKRLAREEKDRLRQAADARKKAEAEATTPPGEAAPDAAPPPAEKPVPAKAKAQAQTPAKPGDKPGDKLPRKPAATPGPGAAGTGKLTGEGGDK